MKSCLTEYIVTVQCDRCVMKRERFRKIAFCQISTSVNLDKNICMNAYGGEEGICIIGVFQP